MRQSPLPVGDDPLRVVELLGADETGIGELLEALEGRLKRIALDTLKQCKRGISRRRRRKVRLCRRTGTAGEETETSSS